jgi:glutamine amidotransferase
VSDRPPIALVDYGAGNLTSVAKALRAAGADVTLAREPTVLDDTAAIVVPGVGHFNATAPLDDRWRAAIRRHVNDGTPLLGICLGLQWLHEGSAEAPELPGLAVLPGRCTWLPDDVKVPHIGWNTLEPVATSRLLRHVAPGDFTYFAHSIAAPIGPATAATTSHGRAFTSVVERGAIFGVQFHPEQSGRVGLQILRNFLDVVCERQERRCSPSA